MASDFTITLERVFQGPMDLLLHLVREQEVEIHEVELSKVIVPPLDWVMWGAAWMPASRNRGVRRDR